MRATSILRRATIPALLALALTAAPASADRIENQFNGTFADGDEYAALFTIHDTADPDVFLATLLNNSPVDGIGTEPLIDLLAFNTTAIFGVDFEIQNINPAWTVEAGDAAGGTNTDFDVVLERTDPGTRLGIGDTLTFNIVALAGGAGINFDTFLLAEEDRGTGIGGGDDEGQKAVSFQQLGEGGDGSDLLADNWDPPTVIRENPEPSTVILLGGAILGMASFLRRRQDS